MVACSTSNGKHVKEARLTFEQCAIGPQGAIVSAQDLERLVEITLNYFPRPEVTRTMILNHLTESSVAVLARHRAKVMAFGSATRLTRLTPFSRRPLPVVFQRMLYVDPVIMGRGVAEIIQVAILCRCLGPFWGFRPFVLVCRTLSPTVAKLLGKFSVTYPQYRVPVPAEIRSFAESLLPVIGSARLDDKFALVDALKPFAGDDYTDIWHRYLKSRSESHDRLLLEAMYIERNGRILNSGSCLMMIAYAESLALLRYVFLMPRGWWARLKWLTQVMRLPRR